LIYFNTLNYNFILDDNFLIVANSFIKNFSISKIFKTEIFYFRPAQYDSFSKYYRPLQSLSYSFDYFFWKLNPLGYRLTNIFIHSFNSLLLFLIIYLIFKNKTLALLSGIFFCIHPIQVCLVTFIAGRSNLLETIFIFSSLVTLIYYFLYGKKIIYWLSIFLFILALLSREGALLLPFFIIFLAFFLKIKKKRLFFSLLPFFFISVMYLAMRLWVMPSDKLNFSNIFSIIKWREFFFYFLDYFQQLILPVGFQRIFFGTNLISKSILTLLALVLLSFFLLRVIILKDKKSLFGLGMYSLGLLPVIKLTEIIPYYGPVLCEHYVYISSMAFCFLFSWLILILYKYFPKLTMSSFIIAVMGFISLTIINNMNYKDELTFYNYVLGVSSSNPIARINLGNIYYRQGEYAKAIKQAYLLLNSEPDAWDGYLLLGNVFKAEGNMQKAIQFYRQAKMLNPLALESNLSLAIALAESGNTQEAEEVFQEALKKFPESVDVRRNIGVLYANKGQLNKAIAIWQEALFLSSDDETIKRNIMRAKELLKTKK
jgi:hypothetical protein